MKYYQTTKTEHMTEYRLERAIAHIRGLLDNYSIGSWQTGRLSEGKLELGAGVDTLLKACWNGLEWTVETTIFVDAKPEVK